MAAQLFLNACPFAACVFIMFFGRMFSHVLRAFMVWLVVLSPLLGYITLKGTSVTRIVLDGQEADLEVTATFLVAVLWCLMSVSCVVYTAIKMARFGKKIESIGIGFFFTMMLNSFYMGYLHEEVVRSMPGVVLYMEWLILLSVVAIATVVHLLRRLPGLDDLIESFIHALMGSFLTMQCVAGMGFDATERLGWRRVLTHDWGCDGQSTGCVVVLSGFIFLAIVGTGVQMVLFRQGQKENPYASMTAAIADMLTSLKNINTAVYSYSVEAEEESTVEALNELRMAFSEDVYKCIGAVSDALLATFTLGLFAACIEMLINRDVYNAFGEESVGYMIWLILFTVLALGIAGFAMKLRWDTMPVGSDAWKKNRTMFMAAVCLSWPFFLFSAFFAMTIGGEEIATVDIPIINQQFGFHRVPRGCESLVLPPPPPPSLAEQVEIVVPVCANGVLDPGEEAVDCGGSCPEECHPCQCAWGRPAYTNQTKAYPEHLVADNPGGLEGCWVGNRATLSDGTAGVAVRYCFAAGGSNCSDDIRSDRYSADVVGWDWLEDGDVARPCSWTEIQEDVYQLYLPQPEASCPPPPPPPPPERRVWYCSAIEIGEVTQCFDCDTELKVCELRDAECVECEDCDDCLGCEDECPLLDPDCDPMDTLMCPTDKTCDNRALSERAKPSIFAPKNPDGSLVDPDDTRAYDADGALCALNQFSSDCQVLSGDCKFRDVSGASCNDVKMIKRELPTVVALVWGVCVCSLVSAMSGSGALGGTYLLVSRFVSYLTALNFVQGVFITITVRLIKSKTGDVMDEFKMMADETADAAAETADSAVDAADAASNLGNSTAGDTAGAALDTSLEAMEGLRDALQAAELWDWLSYIGTWMAIQSVLGLMGMKLANRACGGMLLWVYLVMLSFTLVMALALFGVSAYFALNIDQIADDYWDEAIQPSLAGTNTSAVEMLDLSTLQKHEFVELSRGSFRCLILMGVWVGSMVLALIVGTYYTLGQRHSDEADRSRKRKSKGAISNPMWSKGEEDMNSPMMVGNHDLVVVDDSSSEEEDGGEDGEEEDEYGPDGAILLVDDDASAPADGGAKVDAHRADSDED